MTYIPSENRYSQNNFKHCGKSGLKLPLISLGLWQNFGSTNDYKNCRSMIQYAFDQGITHFDLANNYGPPPGSAEEVFGQILHQDFSTYRDEMVISTKAGYTMWNGPYGDWGSKKYLVSSLDQSLKRMKLDYVDIFYHHRPDPNTQLEETMETLHLMVQQGKALYIGLSNYDHIQSEKAFKILKALGSRCIIHQPKYSMFERWIEKDLLNTLEEYGVGCIPFSPLAQGMLTNKYLKNIPSDSRAARNGSLKSENITENKLEQIFKLNEIAKMRDQSLAQLALAWVIRDPRITSVLIGASKVEQLKDNMAMLSNREFEKDELTEIEYILRNHK